MALARFDVAFHLRHNGKTVLSLHEAHDDTARARRVSAICGPGFLEQALPIEIERNGLHLWGWVGLPTFSRSQADLQYFFVNGRAVRDKLVAHAVRQAYRDVLFNGRHPTFVLFFEVDPAAVDVNVHPTKHEVRFRDGRMVHDFLYGTLYRALGDVRPENQLGGSVPVVAETRPSGPEAGEFGPQGKCVWPTTCWSSRKASLCPACCRWRHWQRLSVSIHASAYLRRAGGRSAKRLP